MSRQLHLIRAKKHFLVTLTVATIFVSGVFISITLDSDFGRVQVNTVSITDSNRTLSGLLYRPSSASDTNPCPAIVLAHGISESKEMMSGIGLELARQGFVALCLDLLGHGGSGGTIEEGTEEPSFGVSSAVQYLRLKPFVNESAIGLVGHSLGAGAVRATFTTDSGIGASVLIAGGLGQIAEGQVYGILNSTSPKNLLVIVGKYDVLFNLTQLEAEELPQVFNTREEVVPGVVYGSYSSQTARKLVTPATTHLFEPIDPMVVSEIVYWMRIVFNPQEISHARANVNQIYLERDVAILVSLTAFLGVILLAFSLVAKAAGLGLKKRMSKVEPLVLSDWKTFLVWGVVGVALFLPMISVGSAIMFPPLIFGASIAWWTLSTGVVGILLLVTFLPRVSKVRVDLKLALVEAFDGKYLIVALVIFILMFVIVSLLEALNFNLRIIVPIFRGLASTRRIFAFFAFLPFFLAYFLAEGLYFYKLENLPRQNHGLLRSLLNCGKVVLGKVLPFVALIGLQYVPAVLFNVWIFPSFVGFLVEFLWLIAPIFIITTVFSWQLYQSTETVWIGAFFDSLMMALVASTVFPF